MRFGLFFGVVRFAMFFFWRLYFLEFRFFRVRSFKLGRFLEISFILVMEEIRFSEGAEGSGGVCG